MNEFIQTALAWSHGSIYWLGALIFITALLECLALVGIVLPGVVLMFALAVIAGSSDLGLPALLLLSWLGGLSGDVLSYALGHRLKHKVPRLPLLRKNPHWLISAQIHFERYGALSLVLGRFIGPLRPILPMVAGMLAMPRSRFFIVSIIAAAGWAIAYTLPGWMVGAALDLNPPKGFWLEAGWVIAILTICAAASIFSSLRAWRSSSFIAASLCALALLSLMLGFQHLAVFDTYLHDLSQIMRTSSFDQIMTAITRLGDFSTQLTVSTLLCTLLLLFKQYRALFFTAITLLTVTLSNYTFKHIFARTRPEILLEPLSNFSFPSGHSASGFAFFLVLGVLAGRQQPQRWRAIWMSAAFIPATLIAVSRVYLTAHWPTDILAGALLASTVCALNLLLIQARQPIPALTKLHWRVIVLVLLIAFATTLSWDFASTLKMYAY